MRCLDTEKETLDLAQRIEKAGASVLTVHGRTKEQKKQLQGPANINIIKKIKKILNIPVIVNGGMSNLEEVNHNLDYTGADGAMSSEAILEYPALFDSSRIHDVDDLALEYIDLFGKYAGKESDLTIMRKHLFHFLHTGLNGADGHHDLRKKLINNNR